MTRDELDAIKARLTEDVPALIAEVERLRAALEKIATLRPSGDWQDDCLAHVNLAEGALYPETPDAPRTDTH